MSIEVNIESLAEYQKRALVTAIFPQDSALEYLALGLGSEVIEVITEAATPEEEAAELGDVYWYMAVLCDHLGIELGELSGPEFKNTRHHVMQRELLDAAGAILSLAKKAIRDDGGEVSPERLARFDRELGRLMSASVELCWIAGVSSKQVLEENLAKLASRAERGALVGDGSNR